MKTLPSCSAIKMMSSHWIIEINDEHGDHIYLIKLELNLN